VDRGIVAFALQGLAQGGLGLGELVLLEIDPAQTIEISAAIGLLLQGTLDQRLRFVKPLPKIA
jgi:hypothetical protein